MRILLIIISIFVSTVCHGADWIKTVDPGGTGDYSSLSLAEAAAPGAGNDIYISCASSDASDDTTTVTISGTGDAVYITGSDFPSNGVWDNDAYVLTTGPSPITVSVPVFTIANLQIDQTTNSTTCGGIYVYNTGGTLAGVIEKCIIKKTGAVTTANYNAGIQTYTLPSGTLNIRNNVIYGFYKAGAVGWGGIIVDDADVTNYIYNNTLYGNYNGVKNYNGSVTVKNCVVFNNTDDFNGAITIDYNASDDNDGTNSVDLNENASGEWAANMPDYATYNFYPASDAAIVDSGVDLSGSGVTDDIIGTSRPQNSVYDIGAFEYAAAGGTVFMHPIRRFLGDGY